MTSPRVLDLAIIVPTLDKYGGAERVVVECLKRWQHRHRITLYAASINEAMLSEFDIGEQVKRRKLSAQFTEAHAMLLNATLLPRLWHDQIGQHDVYHAHLWPTHLIDRHPMVWYPHEPFRMAHDLRFEVRGAGTGMTEAHLYPKLNYDTLADDLFIPYLRAIESADLSLRPERTVANSRYTAQYLRNVYGWDVPDVVYPGAEPSPLQGLPRDPNLFVTVSQLWSHKRTRLLIEALSHTEAAQLLIIGSGPDLQWLELMAERLGVADRVFFLSGLRNAEMQLILARACALLFAPIREPFGIVVLEAMAAGLPVIAADEGGYVEVCTPESAFLVPPYPAAFAEKMSLLQADADLRQRMGVAGREVAARYGWTRTADELEALLIETAKPAAPLQDTVAAPASRPLVGAQYYMWFEEGYGEAHWNDSAVSGYVSDAPQIGYYGSARDGTVISHLKLLEDIGIDFLVLNLHADDQGVNEIEWGSLAVLFERAVAIGSKVRLAVQIVPYTDDLDLVARVVAQIEERWASSEAYLRLGGKPVLFWFWSGALDAHPGIDDLRRASASFTSVATALRLPAAGGEAQLTRGLFEGFTPYSPLELAGAEGRESVWSLAYRSAIDAGMRWKVASVSPGYDDSGLLDRRRIGNPYRVVPRDDGDTYRQGMAWIEGLDQRPDIVVLSTFNEFHENTHIEPSTRLGTVYADLTREFTGRLRARGTTDG